jgi:hypothetical protein
MKNFKNRVDSRTWGVLGKQQTFYAPTQFLGEKVPLNANAFDSWDYKKSKYRRIDLVPRTMENDGQQAGVVPQGTPVTPTPSPTSVTPTPTPTITPTPTLGTCLIYDLVAVNPGITTFVYTDCNGVSQTQLVNFNDTYSACVKGGDVTWDNAGIAINTFVSC